MTTKIIIGAVLITAAFAFGRFSAPEKVRVETKTIEVEKKVEDVNKDRAKHKKTKTKIVKRPDGTEETTTTVTEDTDTKVSQHETDVSRNESDSTREESRSSSKVTISALAGIPADHLFTSAPLVYGLAITKPILGPITVGVWGLSDAKIGASLGLTF